jgi:hypothetical protein
VITSLAMSRAPRFLFFGTAALTLLLPCALRGAGCGKIRPDSTDAVVAAPDHHKVILENDVVRVLEATVPLHSKEPPHTHFWPSVFFEQTSPREEPWKTVNLRWSAGGPTKGYDSSDRDRHNLLIEIKNADCQPAPAPALPATDAVNIHDPNMTVALENVYVRVLSVKIPPGGREPWHTHTLPAVVIYFGLPASVRYTADSQKTARPGFTALQVGYDPDGQPSHSIENVGTVPYQAYRVELKPTTRDPVQ